MSWLSFFGSKNKNEQSSQAEVIAAPPCQQVADKPKPKSQSPFLTDTFCILPWAHLSTRPNGHMRVCCTANASSAAATNDKKWGGEVGILKNDDGKPANLNHTTLSQGWNNGYMKSIRKQMLNGEVPPSCSKCFKEEAAGHRSKRQWETDYWSRRLDVNQLVADTKEDGSVPPQIAYVDLRLGHKCNLKCSMCSPHDSSLWINDWKEMYPQVQSSTLKEIMVWANEGKVDGASYDWYLNNESFWTELYEQIPNLRQLYFAGGEATIIDKHYEILEKCIETDHAHHIELRYNSNGIHMPARLYELWSHFPKVRFHFSVDSVGEMNEYIRFPSKWSVIERQFRRLDETPDNVEVTIACAVQALNIYYLPEFIDWKLAQNFKKINPAPLGAGLINVHFVYHPACLNVKIFPNEFKQKVREKYENYCEKLSERFQDDESFLNNAYGVKRLMGLVKFMESEDWSQRMPEFQEYIKLLDKTRGHSFEKTFPEMAHLIDWQPAKTKQPELTL
jgi:hypothetical protein